MEEQRTLTALRIELRPFPIDGRELEFTVAGAPASVTANERQGDFDALCTYLANVAADPATQPGGRSFGKFNETRVLVGYEGYDAPNFRLQCTIAYPTASEEPLAVVYRATVSPASLARLVDALNAINAAGQGVADWTAAD